MLDNRSPFVDDPRYTHLNLTFLPVGAYANTFANKKKQVK